MAGTFKQPILLMICIALVACSSGVKKNDLLKIQVAAAEAYAQNDWPRAEKQFKYLTQRVPQEGEFWFRLGNIYARTHRPDEAIQAYKEALLRQGSNPKAWHNMGIVYLRQAGNAFTQLLTELDPQDPMFSRVLALNETILQLLDEDNPKIMQLQPVE